jgi:hypothetical protein
VNLRSYAIYLNSGRSSPLPHGPPRQIRERGQLHAGRNEISMWTSRALPQTTLRRRHAPRDGEASSGGSAGFSRALLALLSVDFPPFVSGEIELYELSWSFRVLSWLSFVPTVFPVIQVLSVFWDGYQVIRAMIYSRVGKYPEISRSSTTQHFYMIFLIEFYHATKAISSN